MGRLVRLDSPVTQAIGELGEPAGRLLGDALDRAGRLQRVRLLEHRPQDAQVLRLGQLPVSEAVDVWDRAGEVRMDLEPIQVRHH